MPDTQPLTDQTVVITGASSGIGAATAIRLAAAGANVVAAARNEDKLDALAIKICDQGGSIATQVTDVTDAGQVQALIDHATETFGQVDVLVNNAGLMLFSSWKDLASDEWTKMIDTNLHGYLNAIKAVLPQMLDRESGHILNMSSVAGIRVGEQSGVYSATKFFIRGITDSLRQEVGVEHGIRISMVSPGVIDTGWADKVNDGSKDTAQTLNADAIAPERVADAVLFALAQPADVAVNDIVIHPTKQAW